MHVQGTCAQVQYMTEITVLVEGRQASSLSCWYQVQSMCIEPWNGSEHDFRVNGSRGTRHSQHNLRTITRHLSFLLGCEFLTLTFFHIQSKNPQTSYRIVFIFEGKLGLVCLRLHYRSPNWLPFPPLPCQPANWVSVRFSPSSPLPNMTLPQPGSAEKTIRKIDIAQVRASLVKRNEGERPNFATSGPVFGSCTRCRNTTVELPPPDVAYLDPVRNRFS